MIKRKLFIKADYLLNESKLLTVEWTFFSLVVAVIFGLSIYASEDHSINRIMLGCLDNLKLELNDQTRMKS